VAAEQRNALHVRPGVRRPQKRLSKHLERSSATIVIETGLASRTVSSGWSTLPFHSRSTPTLSVPYQRDKDQRPR
jgi:hypothetical protein